MIVSVENPCKSTKQLLEPITEFSKIAKYKIVFKKNGLFNIKVVWLFSLVIKKHDILSSKGTNAVQDLYTEN